MIERYVILNRALRAVAAAAHELLEAEHFDGEGYATGALTTVLSRALSDLEHMWPKELPRDDIQQAGKALGKGKIDSYYDIANTLIPRLEDILDNYFLGQPSTDLGNVILDLLHPRVTAASYAHFRAGRFRDAVLNSVVAIFDMIRERTSLDGDGTDLIAETFSLQHPRLVFSTLDTESGKNEQKGFIQILQGYYLGVRNPKAHSLTIETDQFKAAQFLVFSSMLCRKVEEAKDASA